MTTMCMEYASQQRDFGCTRIYTMVFISQFRETYKLIRPIAALEIHRTYGAPNSTTAHYTLSKPNLGKLHFL